MDTKVGKKKGQRYIKKKTKKPLWYRRLLKRYYLNEWLAVFEYLIHC